MRLSIFGMIIFAVSCSSGSEQKGKSGQPDGAAPATTIPGDSSDSKNSSPSEGFYTGYDGGTTQFGIILPGFREFTVTDPSIAKIEQIEVTLAEKTVEDLLKKQKEKNPEINVDFLKRRFAGKQTAYKVTPLKAGVTYLQSKGRTGQGSNNGAWNRSDKQKLTVTSYAADAVAAGKSRYTKDGAGNLKACRSCHETGEQNAPPHELGRIMEISDSDARTWITTGEVNDRVAKISHKWEFNDDAEETGVIAYLRSKQTNDLEALIKMRFENEIPGFVAGPIRGGPPGGFGRGGSSTTTSSTTTTTKPE